MNDAAAVPRADEACTKHLSVGVAKAADQKTLIVHCPLTALFLYEMLCIREGIFEFCHDRNFLIRLQVGEIIAFLACE